jgi:outer membrane protein assembly factor BamA
VGDRTRLSFTSFKITPGVGLRMRSMVGPIRLDIAFNPYGLPYGPKYQEIGGNLVLVDPSYRPAAKWYDTFRFNLAIGQAF